MTETVLVTGGAGFIGSRLCAALGGGPRVAVFDNFHPQAHAGNPENRARLLAHGVRVIEGDVRDAPALTRAMAEVRPRLVVHLAAETGTGQSHDLPARYCAVNVQGTAHLIEAIRAAGGVRRVLLASSRSVYGEGACIDAEGRPAQAVERRAEDLARGDFAPKDAAGRRLRPVPTSAACPVAPASIYASTKLMQEYLLTQGFWGSDIEVGVLRLQNVYGVGQSQHNPYTGVLSIFCRQIREGRTLEIFEDGEIVRDFVEVDDVVAAFLAMARAPVCPVGPIDIGSGAGVTIRAAAEMLLAAFGRGRDGLRVTGAFRAGDIRHAVADISRARKTLGWVPRVPLDEGLARLARWSGAVHTAVAE